MDLRLKLSESIASAYHLRYLMASICANLMKWNEIKISFRKKIARFRWKSIKYLRFWWYFSWNEAKRCDKIWKMIENHRFSSILILSAYPLRFSCRAFLRKQAIWWFFLIRGCIPTIWEKMKSCNFIKKHEKSIDFDYFWWFELEIIATDDLKAWKIMKIINFHIFWFF